MMRAVISIVLVLTIGIVVSQEAPQVTISAWQFCEGCKITVDAYARLASLEIKRLDKLPKKEKNTLDALKVMDHMCDDVYFQGYKDFAKFSCIKILDDTRNKFLEEFTGSASLASLSSKKDVFEKKKNICVDYAHACKASVFDDAAIVGTKRNKCAACTLIANDIDSTRRAMSSGQSLRAVLGSDEKSYCDTLGYNHTPYGWLENVCEEMMEEKLDAIIDVVAFHDKVVATGFSPDQTLPQMVCEEFYHCDKDLNVSKKKQKPKKKDAKKKDKKTEL